MKRRWKENRYFNLLRHLFALFAPTSLKRINEHVLEKSAVQQANSLRWQSGIKNGPVLKRQHDKLN
jgi:hypothetical protein